MKDNNQVSVPVIKRLPRYHRYLEELKKMGIVRISSKELSVRMGHTASQIRQDFNCFGGFGQQGYGYNIEQLYNEIGNILGINNSSKAILIGAGNLGHAIATHLNFQNKGFELISIFDNNPEVVGTTVGGLEMMRSVNEENAEETRKIQIVKSAISTLSFSELEAITHIFDELDGNEGILVASKIADRVGITRSVIVNALRKFESAGVIESRSSGMKGTYIKVLNDVIFEELKTLKAANGK